MSLPPPSMGGHRFAVEGGQGFDSMVLAVARADSLAREHMRTVRVTDRRLGRTVYVARPTSRDAGNPYDLTAAEMSVLRQVDRGYAHTAPVKAFRGGRLPIVRRLERRGLVKRTREGRLGDVYVVTNAGLWAMGSFAYARSKARPRKVGT